MHIGKSQNMFYKWFDGKHIQLKKKIFSKSFTTTNAISGDNTENVSEYNDKSVRGSVELNSDKKEMLHVYIQSQGPFFILE